MATAPGLTAVPGLDLVVLTSRTPGIELAAALADLPEVRSLTVVTTRVVPHQSLTRKLRRMYLHGGPTALLGAGLGRLRRPLGARVEQDLAAHVARRCPGACHIHCDDLHAPTALARLRALTPTPDLGIVFATYRLRPEVFTIPRMGCLNLHLGRAPEYRGSSPGFYEMLDGTPEVGVTVHRVSEDLDAGPILRQEIFPIDLAPAEDPMAYLAGYQVEVLIPNGMRLMAEAVRRLAAGTADERAQPPVTSRPHRRATYRLQQELRCRVAQRRACLTARQPGEPVPARN